VTTALRRLARHAEAHGWTIRHTRDGHLVWIAPTGQRVVSASTPSDRRGLRNHRARLRRAGLDVARL
jgi:hypothetical protein